jgi:ketosteroid isomerase-like protein
MVEIAAPCSFARRLLRVFRAGRLLSLYESTSDAAAMTPGTAAETCRAGGEGPCVPGLLSRILGSKEGPVTTPRMWRVSDLPRRAFTDRIGGGIATSRITEAELILVRQYARAIEERDADRIAELLHPDVLLQLYSADQPIIGREAARAWYKQAFTTRIAFEGAAYPDAIEEGAVTMTGRIHWHDKGRGRDQAGTWRITFRDGLIETVIAERL